MPAKLTAIGTGLGVISLVATLWSLLPRPSSDLGVHETLTRVEELAQDIRQSQITRPIINFWHNRQGPDLYAVEERLEAQGIIVHARLVDRSMAATFPEKNRRLIYSPEFQPHAERIRDALAGLFPVELEPSSGVARPILFWLGDEPTALALVATGSEAADRVLARLRGKGWIVAAGSWNGDSDGPAIEAIYRNHAFAARLRADLGNEWPLSLRAAGPADPEFPLILVFRR